MKIKIKNQMKNKIKNQMKNKIKLYIEIKIWKIKKFNKQPNDLKKQWTIHKAKTKLTIKQQQHK